MIGHSISHYEVLSPLGQGGMGVVYKAQDTRLNRLVAIKVLPADKVSDSDRKRRFIQEAQTASALNHPGIVTIYDIDSENGTDFLVMEFIPGNTLSQLLSDGKLRLDDSLNYTAQIADALAAAHGAGIVHRDLKPGNVMVTESGRVKVLDFGLAKLREAIGEQDSTRTNRLVTAEGTIVGTVAYMSPEQAEGRKIDGRSDIFSFGVMLYEMVTGQRPFRGDTAISVLAAILREEPKAPAALSQTIPRELERIILRCLRKDPARRFQTMADLRVALEEVRDELSSGKLIEAAPADVERASSAGRRRPWIAIAAAALIASGVAFLATRQPSPKPENWSVRRLTFDSGLTTTPAVSPDGKMVAYASDRAGEGNLDLYVQQVSGGRSLRLTDHPADDYAPNFSPDGSQIVFRSERDGGGVYVVPVLGGEARLIAPKGSSPRFSPDGKTIAFQLGAMLRDSAIFLAPASGGKATKLQTNVLWAGDPAWSPDGARILFLGSETGRMPDSLYTVPVDGGATRKALPLVAGPGTGAIQWLAGGKLLYSLRNYQGSDGSLWTIRIASDGKALGSPERFTLGAGNERSPAADRSGSRIVFAGLQVGQDLWTIPVRANEGKALGEMRRITQGPASSTYPTISRDGKRLVYTSERSGNWDVYLRDLETGKERALTSAPVVANRAEISPDGESAAFTGAGLVLVVSTHGGIPEKLCERCTTGTVLGWTSDSQRLIGGIGKPISLILLDAKTGKISSLLSHPEWDLHRGQISPDGHWIAFNPRMGATKSGISISPFRNGTGADQKEWIPVTDGEGTDESPIWSPDGNLLYFITSRKEFEDLWAIRLNPETKRPAGEAFEVLSFHSARRPLLAAFGKAVTKDALFWAMQEFTGNIWLAERTP